MRKYLVLFMALLQFLIACDKPKADNADRTKKENPIVELAYNPNYLYPDGFYQDSTSNSSVYYENTVSTKPLSERKDIWIELSTNDKNQALAWSDSSNNYSSVQRTVVSGRETEKYFEFRRQSVTDTWDIILSRIHKTSYFLPLLDKFKKGDTIGIFNGQMIENNVKEFVEYLWGCGSLGIYNSKVLESGITEYNDYFEQYIKSIDIVYGDTGLRDSIYVYENHFRLDKTSRILTLKSNEVEVIEGK